MIRVLTINTDSYWIGREIDGSTIEVIKIVQIYFNGIPFDHYCGYDKDGKMVFSVNCLVPCEVLYY